MKKREKSNMFVNNIHFSCMFVENVVTLHNELKTHITMKKQVLFILLLLAMTSTAQTTIEPNLKWGKPTQE